MRRCRNSTNHQGAETREMFGVSSQSWKYRGRIVQIFLCRLKT
uniref:Uncharacterized protein n=1 Tax=Anguilla anguilla TaxID=7936 RepID=A0A0E9XH33_ANGAN